MAAHHHLSESASRVFTPANSPPFVISSPAQSDGIYERTSARAPLREWFQRKVGSDHFKSHMPRDENQRSMLHIACELHGHSKDLEEVLAYMESREDMITINSPAEGGVTPLHVAAIMRNYEAVKLLVRHAHLDLVSRTSQEEFTALHLTCMFDEAIIASRVYDSRILRLILVAARSARYPTTSFTVINAKDIIDRTPLHYAVWDHDREEVVKELLSYPILEVNSADRDGFTALHLASWRGHENMVRLLLDNPEINCNVRTERANLETQMILGNIEEELQEGPPHARDKLRAGLRVPKLSTYMFDEFRAKVTPLHYAAEKGHDKILQMLLETVDIDVNAQAEGGITPLHLAAHHGYATAVDLIRHPLIDLDAQTSVEKFTALHLCAISGAHSLVTQILQARLLPEGLADVQMIRSIINAEDIMKRTPLHYAVWGKRVQVIKALLKFESLEVNSGDLDGITPLHMASWRGHEDVVALLLGNVGIDCNAATKRQNQETQIKIGENIERNVPWDIMWPNLADYRLTFQIRSKATPLHFAAEKGHSKIVKILLECTEKGMNPNERAEGGITALHLAVHRGKEETVKMLIAHPSVDLDAQTSEEKFTVLHLCAFGGHEKIVKLIPGAHFRPGRSSKKYMRGVINPEDIINRTPLHYAAWGNRVEVVKELLNFRSLEVNSADLGGFTALHLAAWRGHEEIVGLLLENVKVDPNVARSDTRSNLEMHAKIIEQSVTAPWTEPDWPKLNDHIISDPFLSKATPLHCAVEKGHNNIVQMLLGKGVNINAQAEGGITALHLAALNVNHETMKILVAFQSIDLAAQTFAEKFTALHLSARCGFEHVVTVFRAALDVLAQSTTNLAHVSSVINAGDIIKRTPLHYAAWENRVEVVKELLSCPSIQVNCEDVDGCTALHLASWRGHDGIVALLLENADIDPNVATVTKNNQETRSIIAGLPHEVPWNGIHWPRLTDFVFDEGRGKITPLHYAVENNHTSVVSTFVKHDLTDMLKENSQGESVFDVAIQKKEKTVLMALLGRVGKKFDQCEKLLILILTKAKGFEDLEPILFKQIEEELQTLNLRIGIAPKYKVTLIHKVAFAGLDKLLQVLVTSPTISMDINAADSDQQTPLHFATIRGHTLVVKVLMSQPALRACEEDKHRRTALQIAIQCGRRDIEKLLLERDDVKDYVDRLYRDRQVYVDAANAMLVGAALIASVTFAGWLQPPLGYTQYYEFPVLAAPPDTFQSYASVKQHMSTRVFWACNSLSFFSAVATVIAGAGAVLPMPDVFVGEEVRVVRKSVVLTSSLLVFAVMFVLGAFGAAGFASLPPILNLELNMIITCFLGMVLCLVILGWFVTRLYSIRPPWWRKIEMDYFPPCQNNKDSLEDRFYYLWTVSFSICATVLKFCLLAFR